MKKSENILITGAAGYIGSVVAERLADEGYRVIAVDNLKQGHRLALNPETDFICVDLGDPARIDEILSRFDVAAVMHLAADSIVTESMTDPQKYFNNNVVCGLNLLAGMLKNDVRNLIFSSSAAVYGIPESSPIAENASLTPVNPYGESKAVFEKILRWYNIAYGLNSVSLRYFNAAGATELHGEHHVPETHLIPNVLKVALGRAGHLSIFGNDYETADGTCVRDYVHVIDIADAHLKALQCIDRPGVRAYNLGNEKGYSVLEVVKTAENITGIDIPVVFERRRPGDPTVLVASSELAKEELGWRPAHSELADIIRSAWQWQTRFPGGYPAR